MEQQQQQSQGDSNVVVGASSNNIRERSTSPHIPRSTSTSPVPAMPQQQRRRKSMTEEEQRERRASIREIMTDPSLTPLERRRSIQSLMDGRRRSSGAASIATGGRMSEMAAAAAAAAAYYDSDDDDDEELPNRQEPEEESLADPNTSNQGYISSNHSHRQVSDTDPGHSMNTSNHTSIDNSLDDDDRSLENGGVSVESGRSVGSRRSQQSYPRSTRSASLKAFANGAAAVAAAAAAAAECGDYPEDRLNTAKRMEKSRPPCDHYERNCTIISPCCGLAFGCRICHDECPVLPPPTNMVQAKLESAVAAATSVASTGEMDDQGNTKKQRLAKRRSLPTDFDEEDTHHQIDRFAIEEIICRQCFTRQSSKTNNCIQCNVQFGEYHCMICNLWMSAEEDPYHCQDCGFCRVGGRSNFRHCHDCGMCIDALLFDDHNCKAGKYMSNCPVCQEDLFSSRSASHEMPCGHAIHWHCFRELTSFDTRCPVCKKTAETHEQMAPTWSAMAMGIALQPVPPEMARVVTIICNDCEERDDNRRWHFLGVQCLKCSSFNTTVERTNMMGREAASFLEDLSSHHGSLHGSLHTVSQHSIGATNSSPGINNSNSNNNGAGSGNNPGIGFGMGNSASAAGVVNGNNNPFASPFGIGGGLGGSVVNPSVARTGMNPQATSVTNGGRRSEVSMDAGMSSFAPRNSQRSMDFSVTEMDESMRSTGSASRRRPREEQSVIDEMDLSMAGRR